MTAATAGHRREGLIDQDAHVTSSSVEVINENVIGIRSVLGPSLAIDKLHVDSGFKDSDQVRIETEGLVRLRRNSATVKHQNGLDQKHNASSGLAVTDVGLDSADN